MQQNNHNSQFRINKSRATVWVTITVITILLTACGNDFPKLTEVKVFDENFTTVLDTKDPEKLNLISELFYDHQAANDVQADLGFKYLFDLTTAVKSERWRCTVNGYCRQQLEGSTPNRDIFYVERYKELFQVSNLD